jgi:predicted metal-dependent enzyme (double-stranded beta helix superfamily)
VGARGWTADGSYIHPVAEEIAMFDVDTFVEECREALLEGEPLEAVKDVLQRAVASPGAVESALPATRAELHPIYSSSELTIMKAVWAPGMVLPPHDHLMWAAIAIYGGEEDNTFYRRAGGSIEPSGGKCLATGDVCLLGESTVHSVANPRTHSCSGAIHVYGGDFLSKKRSMWDPQSMKELPATGETMRKLFDAANAPGEGAQIW